MGSSRDSNGRTGLHFAAFEGQTAVAEYLLQVAPGAKECRDDEGNTALILAAEGSRLAHSPATVRGGGRIYSPFFFYATLLSCFGWWKIMQIGVHVICYCCYYSVICFRDNVFCFYLFLFFSVLVVLLFWKLKGALMRFSFWR